MKNDDPIDLITGDAKQIMAWYQNRRISNETFIYHVNSVYAQLPNGRYAINLCTDRYTFLVAFAAIMLKKQTNLLPPNHTTATINEIAADFKGCYCISENLLEPLSVPTHQVAIPQVFESASPFECPQIVGQHIACIVFTSGSTGKPQANYKQWKDLVSVAKATQHWLNIAQNSNMTFVATVPPQHMYGLETSILLPLIAGAVIYSGKPFFPADIRATLNQIPGHKALITTPIHLRTCVESDLSWPEVDFILSATAPLLLGLAQQAEQRFKTQVLEIYGCTESGSIAHRRTAAGLEWELYEDMNISQEGDDFLVTSYHLAQAVRLNDNLKLLDQRHFYLLDRKTDLIIIAGKRASLGDLNKKLVAIEGVHDGVFFFPDDNPAQLGKTTRLVAIVVAPSIDEASILAALRNQIDAAFLPRPIYKVDKLPRESSSKLPRKNLLNLFNQLRNSP